jgi:hypothetical protein
MDNFTPDHYKKGAIQPWAYMKSVMTDEEFRGFLVGNVIKYISRYQHKDGLKDLEKAQHYLSKLMDMTK